MAQAEPTIPHEDVLAEFGLTMADGKRWARSRYRKKRPPQCLSASSDEQARADLRGIEQPIALRILRTLARYARRRGQRQAASRYRAT